HDQLRGVRDQARSAEDVALSTLNALCQAAQAGRIENVRDRHDLWRLLMTCTLNRARNLRTAEFCFKRGGGLDGATRAFDPLLLSRFPSPEPTPDEAAELSDQFRYLMDRLDAEDPSHRLRQVALLKLEGYSLVEIARLQNCARKTIVVRISVIRALWRASLLK
ncbi:MAG: ECF-type sigma factor, partial [Planctomycetaceae bacterium]